MQLIFHADRYLDWIEGYPYLPSLIHIARNMYHQGLWGVSLSVKESRSNHVTHFRDLVPLHINFVSNAVNEQVRMVLSGKPDSVTIWNDKREDGCYDPQLFAHQLQDAIEPLKLEKIFIRLQIEPESDLIKETHKMGIRGIVMNATSDMDALRKCIQTAHKLGMVVWITRFGDWRSLLDFKKTIPVDGVILEQTILQFLLEIGSRSALSELTRLID